MHDPQQLEVPDHLSVLPGGIIIEKPSKSIFKQRKGQNTPSTNPGIQITRVTNNIRPMSAMPLKNGVTKNIKSR